MFVIASDYSTLIELLIGAIVVSTFFSGKKIPYPNDTRISILKRTWSELKANYSGHIDEKKYDKKFSKGDWDDRTQRRIKDTMLVMILYGAFSLFYCGNCNRTCCGSITYTITPYGIILDSILIAVYYVFQVARYILKYSSIDKWLRNIKMALSIVLFCLSVSYFKNYHVQDKDIHEIATITILCTCILPMLVLLLYSFRFHRILKKISKYVDKLSCVIIPLKVIEENPDFFVVDKINRILDEVSKETNKNKKLYLMEYCIDLAKDGIQYVSDIENNDYKIHHPEDSEIKSLLYNGNSWCEKRYIKKIQKYLSKPDNNDGINKAKEKKANNLVQLRRDKNSVFDFKIDMFADNITKYGIQLLKSSDENCADNTAG